MGWVLANTCESPQAIYDYIINHIDPIIHKIHFSNYDSYLLVTPDMFE
jgi:hypothetical protein